MDFLLNHTQASGMESEFGTKGVTYRTTTCLSIKDQDYTEHPIMVFP